MEVEYLFVVVVVVVMFRCMRRWMTCPEVTQTRDYWLRLKTERQSPKLNRLCNFSLPAPIWFSSKFPHEKSFQTLLERNISSTAENVTFLLINFPGNSSCEESRRVYDGQSVIIAKEETQAQLGDQLFAPVSLAWSGQQLPSFCFRCCEGLWKDTQVFPCWCYSFPASSFK